MATKPFEIDAEVIWEYRQGGQTRYVPGAVRGFRELPDEVDRRGRVVTRARTQVEIAVPVAAGRKRRFWAEVPALTLASEWVLPQYRQFRPQTHVAAHELVEA